MDDEAGRPVQAPAPAGGAVELAGPGGTHVSGTATAQADLEARPAPAAEPAAQREPAPADRRPSSWARTQRPVLRGVGLGLLLLAIFVLGFAGYLYGLSGVQESRSQAELYTRLQGELANEVAPLGPTTPGTPIAVLDIPSIGIHNMVVVEGTSAENLTLGPGHRRDSPFPGQAGLCQIYGRRATFGAPFARLAQLLPGDIIRVITGQGESLYAVAAFGGSGKMIVDPAPNRLILLTASSPVVPAYYTYVDARLISTARPGRPPARVISTQELPMAGSRGALVLTAVWALALALVAAGGTLAAIWWSPWPAYLAAVPLAIAVLWNLYQSLAVLLPNVF